MKAAASVRRAAGSPSRQKWGLRVLGSVLSMMVAACSAPSGDRTEGVASTRQAIQPTPWTGTWSASPQSGGMTFGQQTLRQVVHTSIGGSAARVQLSNVFGSDSVEISDVHIALNTSGSSIDPTTDRQVTFGGQSMTTISAGGLGVSDAIDFAVPALGKVAVSMYFPQSTNVATYHQQGTQTNYYVSGDVSGNANLDNAQTTSSYYLLANLDVQNNGALGAVVAFGASITDGFASAQDANHRWPDFLATRLNTAGIEVGVLNQGVNGNQLLVDGSGQSALHRFARDVLAQPRVRWVIISDDPINDLGDQRPPPSGGQLTQGLSELLTNAHQAGVKVLCSTLTPFQGASYWTAAGETGRDDYNAFVRSPASGCDAIVDQDTATHDPSKPTWYLPADDSGDHLHPSDQGRQAIADAVPLTLFAATPTSPEAGNEDGSDASDRSIDAQVIDSTPPDDQMADSNSADAGVLATGLQADAEGDDADSASDAPDDETPKIADGGARSSAMGQPSPPSMGTRGCNISPEKVSGDYADISVLFAVGASMVVTRRRANRGAKGR
jgi:lysophospholipase L1-like esterase